ncbi:DUF155 domain-containing protein [Rickettsiales endosymbiont of Paramecium tredecaurelia]|uniref:RMD1 family protein n=1 Tax=Candidatus Sarmatiella mevalonica TaxID=2770581 RepID=UPI001FC8B4FD|nr:RMD1 family protein [Candidatus Sarmatiella mevalonica]MBL3284940.1 DUF155 domain-containing protein [Candidatus Sarmatiella mevalonica]
MNTLSQCLLCCCAYSYNIERIVAFLEKNNKDFIKPSAKLPHDEQSEEHTKHKTPDMHQVREDSQIIATTQWPSGVEFGGEYINFEDALYTRVRIENREIDLFLFSFGCFVAWNASSDLLPKIMNIFQDFGVNILSKAINDFVYFDYSQSQELTINEEKNAIFLQDQTVFLKLSISYALAQSVKLTYLEQSVKQMLESTNPIRETLAATGRVNLSKQELSKQIGSLFNERYSINLHSDILDTPEFFWRKPSYEPLYLMTARFQDIEVRHDILNHRLDMIHDLYSILSNELNYKHSTRLEVTVVFLEIVVVLLIALEVVLGVLRMK